MAEGDNGLGGPPALSREDIEAVLDHHLYAVAESDGVAWVAVRGTREAADAILSLLGRQPSPPHHKGLSI